MQNGKASQPMRPSQKLCDLQSGKRTPGPIRGPPHNYNEVNLTRFIRTPPKCSIRNLQPWRSWNDSIPSGMGRSSLRDCIGYQTNGTRPTHLHRRHSSITALRQRSQPTKPPQVEDHLLTKADQCSEAPVTQQRRQTGLKRTVPVRLGSLTLLAAFQFCRCPRSRKS